MLHTSNNSDSMYFGEKPLENTKYYGKMYYKNGTSYHGYFMNGKKNGYGEEYNKDGYSKGYYTDDFLNGKAITYLKSKGNYIDGYYQNGLLNGECLFFDEKGILQNKGMYKNGKSCVATYEVIIKAINDKNFKVYEGYMYDDKYNGFGKLYENDKVYIGNFTQGKKDGKFMVCNLEGKVIYSPQQSNMEIIIDIDKVNKDNFSTYKNTIIYTNDVYDDDHKIVIKENNIIKYIGKLNNEMKYNDDNGVLYNNNNSYTGKFENGEFKSGTYNFTGGRYKGDFKGLEFNGQGIIEFENGNKFEGEFTNNQSKLGKFYFKHENNDVNIECKVYLTDEGVMFNIPTNTKFILDSTNRYEGEFKFVKTNNNINKLNILCGKHYENNILVYEGEFKNFKYNGSGIKYHPNGNLNITGSFEQGEPYKAEYYDESGNLIFSDLGDDTNMLPNEIENNLQASILNMLQGLTNSPLMPEIQNVQNILQTVVQTIQNNTNNTNNTETEEYDENEEAEEDEDEELDEDEENEE